MTAKLCFLTVGDITWASSRLRSYWPVKYLEGSETIAYKKGAEIPVGGFDAYVWMKTGEPEAMEMQRKNGGHVIVEVCDPNWWFQPIKTRRLIDESTCLVAATAAAGEDLKRWYGPNTPPIYIVPDRLELDHFPRQRKHEHTDNVRFIWYGVAANRMSLFSALANLERLAANGIKFSLTICDERPDVRWNTTKSIPVYQVEWDLDKENEILASHDIALLPPYPGPWGRLKSNNKKLTAWACGLPVTDGQEYYNMETLTTNTEERKRRAEMGYKTLLKDYLIEQTAEQWLDIIEIENERRELCTE